MNLFISIGICMLSISIMGLFGMQGKVKVLTEEEYFQSYNVVERIYIILSVLGASLTLVGYLIRLFI